MLELELLDGGASTSISRTTRDRLISHTFRSAAYDDGDQTRAIPDRQAPYEPGEASTERRPAIAGPQPGDWRFGRACCGGVHIADWPARGPHVPRGRIRMATDFGSYARFT